MRTECTKKHFKFLEQRRINSERQGNHRLFLSPGEMVMRKRVLTFGGGTLSSAASVTTADTVAYGLLILSKPR